MINATSSDENALRELRELASRVIAAYESDDAELYASTVASDAVVSMPGMEPVVGREALKTAFSSRPALPPGAKFEVAPEELNLLGPDWAYVFGKDTLTIPDGEGGNSTQTMTFMVLLRRTSEGWKTFREVMSPDQPA